MVITAALCWWNEQPAWLERCVSSLAGRVDRLVSCDAAWEGIDYGHEPTSPIEQQEALRDAADEIGLEHVAWSILGVWKSQVYKRIHLMQEAAKNSDWILVIDADEYIETWDNAGVRASLGYHGDVHAFNVTIRQLNKTRPYSALGVRDRTSPRLYRAGTTVDTWHNGYRYQGQWLNGDRAHVRVVPSLTPAPPVVLAHDNMNRPPARLQAAMNYRKWRSTNQIEEPHADQPRRASRDQ